MNILKKIRLKYDLMQKQLAKRLDISVRHLQGVETDARPLSAEVARRAEKCREELEEELGDT